MSAQVTAVTGVPGEAAGLGAVELAAAIRAGRISAVDAVQASLARIEAVNPLVNAVCTTDPEGALAAAAEADRRRAAGAPLGPLHGVPVLIKDLVFTRGLRTTGGSLLYRDFVPDQDDVAVERLRAAGAIIVGKTNTAEFGFSGNRTENRVFGRTRNPWNLDRTPGGSSGGSAAAVASGMAPLALGSDGGGSIRIPASFCGTVGLKPSFGRIPLYPGCRDDAFPGFSAWESLEHYGPISSDVRGAALMLDVLSGLDTRDRLSSPSGPADFLGGLDRVEGRDLGDLRIAWSADWNGQQPLDDEVRDAFMLAVRELETAGARLTAGAPACQGAVEAFSAIVALDLDAPGLAAFARGREELLGGRLRDLLGQAWSAEQFSAGVRRRRQIYLAVERFFADHDVLVTPTVPVTAFDGGQEGPLLVGGVPPRDQIRAIVGYCCPFNLTGHPAASVPWAWSPDGLPIGVQVVAPRYREDTVLRVARVLERACRGRPATQPPGAPA